MDSGARRGRWTSFWLTAVFGAGLAMGGAGACKKESATGPAGLGTGPGGAGTGGSGGPSASRTGGTSGVGSVTTTSAGGAGGASTTSSTATTTTGGGGAPVDGGGPDAAQDGGAGDGGPQYGPEGQSCATPLNCEGVSCCQNILVPGGTFGMGRSTSPGDSNYYPGGQSDEIPQHAVTIASYHLDTFEVTVGRFRQFVNAFNGAPPPAGAGAHPLIAGSGWDASWNASLDASQAALLGSVKGCSPYNTWTDAPGANENAAINCVDWFEAFAFCAWDGGRIPTEAEWEYAAAGGSDNRLFPWGAADPSLLANANLANDAYGNNTNPAIAVGSYPAGNGKWGHRDLAGGMWEWNFDWYDAQWYSGVGLSCTNCANLNDASLQRVYRGGSWDFTAFSLRAAFRLGIDPLYRAHDQGFRCARTP